MPDTTFITNEKGQSLKDRFAEIIKQTKYFDCLVAYFYISGFHLIYKSLESTKKIRILVGIKTDETISNIVSYATNSLKEKYGKSLIEEVSESTELKDTLESESGISVFLDWLKKGKIQIKIYESQNIHAKLYIATLKDDNMDKGRVITGSSNFTKSGLEDNLEFNVELKNRNDYEFAKDKFEELWKKSVDLSEHCIDTLEKHTWLRQTTPYELYLKCLYEYFESDLSQPDTISETPDGIQAFEYQKQAILNAKKIVDEYGGVFISDVVGLGKTYMTSGLCKLLGGRTLVITPPVLTKDGEGSWKNVLNYYGVNNEVESLGQLEKIIKSSRTYENVVIDEAHRFRNEYTSQYDHLLQICHDRKVILVTATPFNNRLDDIKNLIKLFHPITKSFIPGISNLESYFSVLKSKLPNKRKSPEKYKTISSEHAKEVREKVLKYLMIRRTRADIKKYFKGDLKNGKLHFPEVQKPRISYYHLDSSTDALFHKTIKHLVKDMSYVRYSPLLELKENLKKKEDINETSQKNMKTLMKILLVKRLDSSFHAFKKSINKFIEYYEHFIKTYEKGTVYISKEYANKIFQLLENPEGIEEVETLIESGKAEKYHSEDFKPTLKDKLYKDLHILKELQSQWNYIDSDPKIKKLLENLDENLFKKNKIILFTEFKDTAEYLFEELESKNSINPILFHGTASQKDINTVKLNFDGNVVKTNQENNYNLLITTDVLSESVNLHRSNIIINYDIPWNPTKMIQRAGRVNRLSTTFDKIYIMNFFPTKQSDDQIKLENSAKTKIESFLNLLGGDSYILTGDETTGSHELFQKLTHFGEEESVNPELEHYEAIKSIRDHNPRLFENIKNLPKKIRSSKKNKPSITDDFLITFFRKNNMKKFLISYNNHLTSELDALEAMNILKSKENEKETSIPKKIFFHLFHQNKQKFYDLFESENITKKRGQGIEDKVIHILKLFLEKSKSLTELNEIYINRIIDRIKNRRIAKQSLKIIHKTLKNIDLKNLDTSYTHKLIATLEQHIHFKLLSAPKIESSKKQAGYKKEVILSLYGHSK